MAMQDPARYGKIGLLTTAMVSFVTHNTPPFGSRRDFF